MKIGDLVKWSDLQIAWNLTNFCFRNDLTDQRQCGIIIDNNPMYLFVRWENGEILAQKAEELVVISKGWRSGKTQRIWVQANSGSGT